MLLTCECYGEPPKHDRNIAKRRNTPSKKCNCPFMLRVYCFETPTKLYAEAKHHSKTTEEIRFLPGVYIYEYPNADHTCNSSIAKQIVETFQSEKLYTMDYSAPSCSNNDDKRLYTTEKFWNNAMILYKSDISQDKAFQILAQEGMHFHLFTKMT